MYLHVLLIRARINVYETFINVFGNNSNTKSTHT